MTKILFSNPPFWDNTPDGLRKGIRAGSRWPFTLHAPHAPDQFVFGGYIPTPIFLQGAAAWVQRAHPEWTVAVRDSIARGESYGKFFDWLAGFAPDVFVIETGAASWEHDKKLLRALKQRLPDCRIGIAGPPTQDFAARGDFPEADAWILGEFEKTSLAFCEGRDGIIPHNLLTREEMAASPFPIYDEEVWHHYADGCPKGTEFPEITLWASRGCFAVCNFCAFPATMTNNDPLGLGSRKIRFYPAAWIEGFLRERIEKANRGGRPIRSVRFDGDTENAQNKHTLEICEVMRRIGIPWSMMCRADTSSREVWQTMKDSGCFGVKIGFESGVQRVVDEIVHKGLDLKEAVATARFLRSIGLSVHGTFTVNLPGETHEEQRETVEFIKMLYANDAINSHQLSGTAEIPGTPLARIPHDDAHYVPSPDGQQKIEHLVI